MKKEDWINSILESTVEITEAEHNPYLFGKIRNKIIQSEKEASPVFKYNFRWVAAISLVIAINVSAFFIYKSKIHEQNEELAIESLSNEMISNTTYNY